MLAVFYFALFIILVVAETLTGSVKLWIEDGFLYMKLFLSAADDSRETTAASCSS